MDKPKELALFAGIGGGLLGTYGDWDTVCCVEWNRYAAAILQARMSDGLLHECPIWDDVRSFDGTAWRGLVDVVSAGFPCQPFTTAGTQKGADDTRNMWPATVRVIRQVVPRFLFLENVPGLMSGKHRYIETVFGDLAELGYDLEWGILGAADVGAPHKRDRLWIAATLRDIECSDTCGRRLSESRQPRRSGRETPDRDRETGQSLDGSIWTVEPRMDRMAYGVPDRVDRLTALGNAQTPHTVATAKKALLG